MKRSAVLVFILFAFWVAGERSGSAQAVEAMDGRGLYINAGARELLLQAERQRFLSEQWPAIRATIQRLGLTAGDLLPQGGEG